jgi:hypothetical protein
MALSLSGGCQCGAVRYRLEAAPFHVHVCHCRMCQKAVGGPFAVICPVLKSQFAVTRGAMSHFASSGVALRGFCAQCGTPLTFEGEHVGVLVGTLDHPDLAPPVAQYGVESRVPWYGDLAALPGDKPTYADNPDMLARIAISNHQHPDHDTDVSPPIAEARRRN